MWKVYILDVQLGLHLDMALPGIVQLGPHLVPPVLLLASVLGWLVLWLLQWFSSMYLWLWHFLQLQLFSLVPGLVVVVRLVSVGAPLWFSSELVGLVKVGWHHGYPARSTNSAA